MKKLIVEINNGLKVLKGQKSGNKRHIKLMTEMQSKIALFLGNIESIQNTLKSIDAKLEVTNIDSEIYKKLLNKKLYVETFLQKINEETFEMMHLYNYLEKLFELQKLQHHYTTLNFKPQIKAIEDEEIERKKNASKKI